MNKWITQNGIRILQVLSGRGNSYLVLFDNQSILIDTGKKSAYERLIENIAGLKLGDSKISYLFLTHTHFDHCQSAKRIKDKYNCQVIVSESVVNAIKNGYTRIPKGTLLTTKLIAKLGRAIGKRKYGYAPFQADILIEDDNNSLFNSFDIKIIQTAGHSVDSISLIINNEIAIVGDAMFGVFKNAIFPPFSDDIKQMIKSWEKLLNTRCEIFLPGHGKEIKRDLLQREFDKYASKYKVF